MASITLTVNGATRTVDAAEDAPLLYVLRNQLELSGPKLGCEMAQCGACAVLADGEEIRSCVTRAANVAGRSIVTIEGLAAVWAEKKGLDRAQAARTLHPIQQAWIDLQVPQCGYCQSGMMVAAADLLERNPAPTEADIREAFSNTPPSPHLCRCGMYAAIIEAVQRAGRAMAD
ncbi:MAG: (2Fe-2S)-binding protein [Acidobacteria bacterium]|nr:(2Fe-2S)-binding protein [Acidobacteriota bacterium]